MLTQKSLKYVAMEVQRRKYPCKLRNLRISAPLLGVTQIDVHQMRKGESRLRKGHGVDQEHLNTDS